MRLLTAASDVMESVSQPTCTRCRKPVRNNHRHKYKINEIRLCCMWRKTIMPVKYFQKLIKKIAFVVHSLSLDSVLQILPLICSLKYFNRLINIARDTRGESQELDLKRIYSFLSHTGSTKQGDTFFRAVWNQTGSPNVEGVKEKLPVSVLWYRHTSLTCTAAEIKPP